jgi:hypothetical protein
VLSSGRRLALVALEGFVAASAAGGGVAIATGVDRFPPEWLHGSPFADYLWPGIILAGIVGLGSALAAWTVWGRNQAAGPASVAAGLILAGWIAGEVVLLEQNGAATSPRGPIEVLYLAVGLIEVGLGAAAWRAGVAEAAH